MAAQFALLILMGASVAALQRFVPPWGERYPFTVGLTNGLLAAWRYETLVASAWSMFAVVLTMLFVWQQRVQLGRPRWQAVSATIYESLPSALGWFVASSCMFDIWTSGNPLLIIVNAVFPTVISFCWIELLCVISACLVPRWPAAFVSFAAFASTVTGYFLYSILSHIL
jgi:hypothetical protein